MNAGSFGVETASRISKVGLFTPTLGLVERHISDFECAYRHCMPRGYQGWFLVTSALLRFQRSSTEQVRARIRETFLKKQERQPVSCKSAGCVFKNPSPETPAGKLLDEAGLKGVSIGDMYFSTLHANFMINAGSGTFAQAMELIELALDRVRAHSGHELELEVQLW
jgi:UDP-N-acetylmuramate dehydrogenase